MTDILKLKRARTSALESVRSQDAAFKTKTTYKDERYWQPVTDKAGNGSAIIRFLPGIWIPDTEDYEKPVVRLWNHAFEGPGGWYIENNRNSLDPEGKNVGDAKDPVSTYNKQLYASKDKAKIAQATAQRRQLRYISNIYVIKHPNRPDDEGKVFLYRYGPKIYDKISAKVSPSEDDGLAESPLNIFNLWEGANFRLKIKNVKGFRNYDDSSFDNPSPLSDDDGELERIFRQEYSVAAEVSEDKFKSYEELEKRLYEALGLDMGDDPAPVARTQPKAEKPMAEPVEDTEPPFDVDEQPKSVKSDSDMDNFFKKLRERAQGG
jgi:gp32 DNA binding protein like